MEDTKQKQYDVIIIGGSYAGLSAAMALGRSLRRVLIIDSGLPCNRFTPHSHNFIAHDGATPSSIASTAKKQVLQYTTVEFYTGLATTAYQKEERFYIELATGKTFSARKLILATGMRDILPDIDGFADSWGKSLIHCPYCHGYEFRDKKTGIMANGDRAMHLVSLINNLTNKITLLTNGKATFSEEQKRSLHLHRINIIEDNVTKIEHTDGQIQQVHFQQEQPVPLDALYAAVPFEQQTDIPTQLGCALTESGHIQIDAYQQTNKTGIFACGDSATMMRSVAQAVATGNIAGAMANHQLAQEDWEKNEK